jgi:hypothetical protein
VFSAPKKSGKTGFAALHTLTMCLLFGGQYAEGYCVANDLEQAQGRVFLAIKRIVESSPELRAIARVFSDRVEFPITGASIAALASDYAGAAGANPTISTFDELWGYTSERSRRLWDEMVPPPTRKIACRLTTTYAGFEGESTLLEELYKRGLAQPQIGADLHAGDGLLMFWSHVPVAPWQSVEWVEQMRRQLRPNAFLRMIENRFVSTESIFVDPEWIDNCIDPAGSPVIGDRALPVYVGVDASVKKDSTAIVAVCFDRSANKGSSCCASNIPADPSGATELRGDRRAHSKGTVRPIFRARRLLRPVSDDERGATACNGGPANARIYANDRPPNRNRLEPVRAHQRRQHRSVSRCSHQAGAEPCCGEGNAPRVENHQREAKPQDRRGDRDGDGRACRR